MANTNSKWDKFFFVFFVAAVISGIYLIIQGDYLMGVSGTITGLFLIYQQRMNKAKQKNNGES